MHWPFCLIFDLMKANKFPWLFLVLLIYVDASAQTTLETGIPSRYLNLRLNDASYPLDHYLKVGRQNRKLGYGLIGIATFAPQFGEEYALSAGSYVNYKIKPLKNIPIVVFPEAAVIVMRTEYRSELDYSPSYLASANIGLGFGCELNKNWEILSTAYVGYGKRWPSSQYRSEWVFTYPLGVGFGLKYIFNDTD